MSGPQKESPEAASSTDGAPMVVSDFAKDFQVRPPATQAETERFLEIMSNLIEHPGWKIYAGRIQQLFEVERNAIIETQDMALLPLKVGRVRAIRMLIDWPLIQAKACQEALKQELDDPGSVFLATEVDKEAEK
jgi:hypothetical protein